jgi:SH3 domain-containing YSC84-like protein 1
MSKCDIRQSKCANTPRRFGLASVCLVLLVLPVWAASKDKDERTLRNAGNVLQQMLSDLNIPSDVIAKADCVLVLPDVKKFGFGIGASGGRGPMVCRSAATGKWSAPVMYSISGVSAGPQVGGNSSDYVLLIMTDKGENALLSGKSKLGRDATAAAGLSGASAASFSGNDVQCYKRAKGFFAGASLGGALLEPDDAANQRLYGKSMSAQEIVQGNGVPTPSGAQGMVSLLDSRYAKY